MIRFQEIIEPDIVNPNEKYHEKNQNGNKENPEFNFQCGQNQQQNNKETDVEIMFHPTKILGLFQQNQTVFFSEKIIVNQNVTNFFFLKIIDFYQFGNLLFFQNLVRHKKRKSSCGIEFATQMLEVELRRIFKQLLSFSIEIIWVVISTETKNHGIDFWIFQIVFG